MVNLKDLSDFKGDAILSLFLQDVLAYKIVKRTEE